MRESPSSARAIECTDHRSSEPSLTRHRRGARVTRVAGRARPSSTRRRAPATRARPALAEDVEDDDCQAGSGSESSPPDRGLRAMLSETNEPTGGERQVVERLEAVTDTALAQLSLDELLHELLVRVQRILAADTAAIFLLDGDVLVERAAAGLEEADTRVIRIPVGAGFVGRVAAEKRPVVIEHVDRAQLAHPVLRESGIRSLLGVPILFEGRGIGVLHVGTLQPRHFRRD